jgi:Spy/CpxP family protein refolding chaperone
MKSLRKYVFIALAGLLMGLPAVSHSEDVPSTSPVKTGEQHDSDKLEKMTEKLSLTPEQVEKMKVIFDKYKTNKEAQHEKVKNAYKDLNDSPNSDASESDIRAKHTALQAIKNDMDKTRLDKILEIRAILTKEQREKFEGMKMDHKRHGGPHKDKGPRQ